MAGNLADWRRGLGSVSRRTPLTIPEGVLGVSDTIVHVWNPEGFLVSASGLQESLQGICKLEDVVSLALPNDKDLPAGVLQLFEIAFVSFDVTLAFFLPELGVSGWRDPAKTAAVDMPETPVNKNYLFMPDQHKVRVAGQIAAMQGIAITHLMNKRTNNHFRQSIL